jgi:DNA-binding CsgD family transcriptional regulator
VKRRPISFLVLSVVILVALFAPVPSAGQQPGTYSPPRTPDGHPDLQGIWQVLNTAAWDIQDHHAELGIPAGKGVVEGNEIPYLPAALKKKQENAANRQTLDPDAKCFLPGVPRITYICPTIRGGASGFLLKESAGDELLTAVRHALDGNVYITPTVTKDVMERMTGAAKEPQLTPRQRDILRLIVKGQRMKEIAANLGLSTRTVEGHKYDMMETLGVTSTAELVRYALDRRLKVD